MKSGPQPAGATTVRPDLGADLTAPDFQKKSKPVSPVIVELIIGDLVHKVAGSDEVAKPYDHLLFLDVPPKQRFVTHV